MTGYNHIYEIEIITGYQLPKVTIDIGVWISFPSRRNGRIASRRDRNQLGSLGDADRVGMVLAPRTEPDKTDSH
jgi:hypothetical protein